MSPPRTVIFFKPYDVLSQFTAEVEGQRTLAEFSLPPGIYPAGRLDRDSEGLLLLSDDGRLIRRLLEPRHAHRRTYWAQVEGIAGEAALAALRAGVSIRVGKAMTRTLPCEVSSCQPEPSLPERQPPIRYRAAIPTSWLQLTLTEGKNRQVRKMTAAVGHPTLRLFRAGLAGLWWNQGVLEGLQPGEWRDISRLPLDL